MVNSFFSTYNEGGTGVINTDGTVSYYTLNPDKLRNIKTSM